MGRAILRKRVLQASIFRGSVNFCEIRQPFPRLPAWSWLQNRNTYGKTIQEAKPTETELGKSPCLEVHAPGSPLEKPTFRTCYKTRIGPFHHWVRHTKSRCRYLDMFLTICLKKRHSSSIRIILHTKMSPKEISKHEDLPTCFDRFVQFSWEMRRDPRNIGNACTSMSFTVLCVISSLQNKENPKKQKKNEENNKNGTSKGNVSLQCTYYRIHDTGKYLLNNLPIQNPTLHGSENLFYHRQIFCKIYGLHSWINTCGKTPPCKPLPNWLNKKGCLSTKTTWGRIPLQYCALGCVLYNSWIHKVLL